MACAYDGREDLRIWLLAISSSEGRGGGEENWLKRRDNSRAAPSQLALLSKMN